MREIASAIGTHRRRVAESWRRLRARYPDVTDLEPVDSKKPMSLSAAGANRIARYFSAREAV